MCIRDRHCHDTRTYTLDKNASTKESALLRHLAIDEGDEFSIRSPATEQDIDHGFLCPDTFERFAKYLEDPELVIQGGASKPGGNQQGSGGQAGLMEDLERQYSTHREAIESEKQAERNSLMQGLEQSLEEDMMSLRLQHKRQVALEDEKLRNKYSQCLHEVELHYQRERQLLRSMLSKTGSKQTELGSKQVGEQIEASRYMFGGDMLPRLLALGCMLEARGFTQLCLDQAAATIDQVCGLEGWDTAFIPATLIEQLISALTDTQVVHLSLSRRCKLPMALIQSDLEMRKKIAEESLHRMSGSKLRQAATAPEVAFPHLVRKEIEARRTAYSVVSISRRLLSPNCELSEDQLSVTTIHPRQYACAHATKALSTTGDGMWYWEVGVRKLPPDGSSMAIGFDSPRELEEMVSDPTPLQGQSVPAENSQTPMSVVGWVWQSDGIMHLNGQTLSTERTYKQGDVVGVGLDLDNRLICFYLNGAPAFTATDHKALPSHCHDTSTHCHDTHGHDARSKSPVSLGHDKVMRVLLPNRALGSLMQGPHPAAHPAAQPSQHDFSLVPAVCMYATSPTCPCQAVCNFGGSLELAPFAELPLGHDPLGGKLSMLRAGRLVHRISRWESVVSSP
eukprot:TRINITY_DN22100_c0_g1_i3.p1 TRINITY_DN22100_c0_g1~~TRINITY_DN22100_c0_g1_i3.p1  ORF type:complete len:622 (-),score=119.07 TRINITY_DN22100_c0_g1_i3:259-2124(-)